MRFSDEGEAITSKVSAVLATEWQKLVQSSEIGYHFLIDPRGYSNLRFWMMETRHADDGPEGRLVFADTVEGLEAFRAGGQNATATESGLPAGDESGGR